MRIGNPYVLTFGYLMKTIKKKLLVDLCKLTESYCGLWEVAYQYAQALIGTIDFNQWEVTLLVPADHPFVSRKVKYKKLRWWHRFSSQWWQYDVVHALAQNSPYLRRKNSKSKYVVTLHDLNFLYETHVNLASLAKYQQNARQLDYVVCISNFVLKDVRAHLRTGKAQLAVVHNGVATRNVIATQPPSVIPNTFFDKEFLFIISTIMRKKNIHLLVDMMRFLPHLHLVIAGKVIHQDYYEELLAAIARYDLSDRVVLTGTVSEAEKYWLYDHCKAFVFPSAAEGFGIPPVEAMQAGKPVFALRATSIPEVCGTMAFYWDNTSPQAMAQFVINSLANASVPQNDPIQLKKHAAQYSWEQCAQQYIQIYNLLTQ
jgi:glycosyltransferase involved in cell wall biosynthesis